MLDALKRKMGLTPDAPEAETQTQDVKMEDVITAPGLQIDPDGSLTASSTTIGSLTAVDTELQATVTSLTEQLATANAQVAELTALVAAAADFQAAQVKAAADAKASARHAAIVAAVGTDKADALMAATVSMEDGAFSAVMSALNTTASTEADTALFKEVGVDAEASATALDSNPVMDYLTAKYKQQA